MGTPKTWHRSNHKSTLEDEKHDCPINACTVRNNGLIKDLINWGCLDGHDAGHDSDHREERASTEAVYEKPGDEGC